MKDLYAEEKKDYGCRHWIHSTIPLNGEWVAVFGDFDPKKQEAWVDFMPVMALLVIEYESEDKEVTGQRIFPLMTGRTGDSWYSLDLIDIEDEPICIIPKAEYESDGLYGGSLARNKQFWLNEINEKKSRAL